MRRVCVFGALGALAVAPAGFAQLMVADSGTGDRIMLFDDFDGSLINADWITDIGAVGWAFTTPKEALRVGNEIWVSDQVTDAIHRFDMGQNYLSSITQHPNGSALDNLRGMGFDGSKVYLSISPGTAANRGVVTYAMDGTPGSFLIQNSTSSFFDVGVFGNQLLVTNSTNDNVERYDNGGVFINNFATGLDFPQQVDVLPDMTVIAVASIGTAGVEGVYRFNPDGTVHTFIDTEVLKGLFGEQVPRAAWPLGDGGYLISTSIGIYKATDNGGGGFNFSQILAGVNGQYINPIPAPGTMAVIGLGLVGLRRRR